jgi:hypothetical protein
MWRQTAAAAEPLVPGARVAPGDQLFLEFEASKPVHVYVINEDERGETYLLFPIRGLDPGNPVSGGRVHRLPGTTGGRQVHWGISSAGGREHFMVVASPERLFDFEEEIAGLARPSTAGPLPLGQLSEQARLRLRGAGLLIHGPPAGATDAASGPPARMNRLAAILGDRPETADGVWLRRIDFENPAR